MGIGMNIWGDEAEEKRTQKCCWVGRAACRRTGTKGPCQRCTEGLWGLEMIQPQRLHLFFFTLMPPASRALFTLNP